LALLQLHFAPPLPDLLRRGGAGRPDLLDGDRRDQVPERCRLLVRRPGHHRAGDPGAATVPGADDVDGTGYGVGGDVLGRHLRMFTPRLVEENTSLPGGAEDRPLALRQQQVWPEAKVIAGGTAALDDALALVWLHAYVRELPDPLAAVGEHELVRPLLAPLRQPFPHPPRDDAAVLLAHLVEHD